MLWRLHLRPAPKNGKTHNDVVNYCIQNNIAGIGWPVIPTPETADEYAQLAKNIYRKRPSSVSFAQKPRSGDLIWARSKSGEYYLGRIQEDGDWKYSDDPLHLELDIPNQRHCVWIVIGTEEKVPGKIVACFRPMQTFQPINDPLMQDFSEWIYRTKSRGDSADISFKAGSMSPSDFFKLIGSEDCEDIVGLYLQRIKGYCLIPSSCKQTTIGYEFVLKHNQTGQTAIAQVKQGYVPLDDKLQKMADHVFLFSTEGPVNAVSDKIIILSTEELFAFILQNRRLLPDRINYWFSIFQPQIDNNLASSL